MQKNIIYNVKLHRIYRQIISLFKIDAIEPTLRGLIRDGIDFDFYYEEEKDIAGIHYNYLIILKGDWKKKIKYDRLGPNLLPSIDGDQWYIDELHGSDWYGSDWTKVDDVETWLDAKKYNV